MWQSGLAVLAIAWDGIGTSMESERYIADKTMADLISRSMSEVCALIRLIVESKVL
jgi:hypothetical protein